MAITQGGGINYDPSAIKQAQEESQATKAQKTLNDQDTLPQRSADNEGFAWNKLRMANRDAETINFEKAGDVTVRAGLTTQVSGYGIADGIYLVDKCSHRIGSGGSGYTTTGEAHKRLIGYGGSGGSSGASSGTGGGNIAPATNPTGSSIPGATASSNAGPELQ